MRHVVLLGDSIFDNASYVPGQPDVIRQVRAKLPNGWQATLLAVDGATIRSIQGQIQNLPADTSHVVVSVGGNDALGAANILFENVRSVAEAIEKLSTIRERFAMHYRQMLNTVLVRQLPTAVCTIYGGRANSKTQQHINETALTIFNDVITREAFRRGLMLIDLRVICTEPADYANPIEPLAQGGEKMATAIVNVVTGSSALAGSQVCAG